MRILVCALVLGALGLCASPALARGPIQNGTLTLSGALQNGSTVTATGVTWTPVSGTHQSVSYQWSACQSACGSVAVPSHQPFVPKLLLNGGDVGKRIRVREIATDVAGDGTSYVASTTFTTSGPVAAWPTGTAPHTSLIYGLPAVQTSADQERFDFSPAHANSADGAVTIACALDGGSLSTACASRRSFLTAVLASGQHTFEVVTSNTAGSTKTSYTWTVEPMPAPQSCSACFEPPHLDSTGHPMSWDWQLEGALAFRTVDMFDIDAFDNSAAVVAKAHARAGRTLPQEKAICYLSLGSWENFRSDEARWPASTRGLALAGYANEHWVDVRQLSGLMPVIDARLQMCASKGFDGVEVDNIDGWDNDSGFPLTPADAEAWLAAIANEAHSLNLFVVWKNDPYLASFGERYFDGALSEQCFAYEECTAAQNDGTTFFTGMTCNTTTWPCGVRQFASAGKWVGEVEYKYGVTAEDGVVCDPSQTCTLRQNSNGYLEVPFKTYCADAYGGFGLSAMRKYESDQLVAASTFGCW